MTHETAFDEFNFYEDVMELTHTSPAEIANVTRWKLETVRAGELFAIHNAAENLANAIRFELEFRDGDMAAVVEQQGAMLEAFIEWLSERGLDCHALRDRKPTNQSRQEVLRVRALCDAMTEADVG